MHEMAKKANVERQTALRTDADKLFKLATELKTYVEKSNEHVMSVDVIKKADEIENSATKSGTRRRNGGFIVQYLRRR